jgi:hypothetical protein
MEQAREDLLSFLIHISAIIGGIFIIFSVLDAAIHKSVGAVFKGRIGKLI